MFEHSYFIAAIAVVICFVILRFMILRWRNQAFFDFLRTNNSSQYNNPPHDSDYRSMYHGLQLAPVPAAYHPAGHRVRAVDTDAYGRRLGPGGEDLGGKDVLPAYDNFDRPPKYVEAGYSQVGPPGPLPVEQSAVTPFTNGEQSTTAHPDLSSSSPRDNEDQSINNTGGRSPTTHQALSSS